MKQRIRLTESELHRLIKESVLNVLSEHTNPFGYSDYEGEDMSYESVHDSATSKLVNDYNRGKHYSSVPELIDALYDAKSFNEIDYEIVYDACEDAMRGFEEDIIKKILPRR